MSASLESYLNLIRQVDDLIAAFADHPDPRTVERAGALLGGVDALHREGLTRLVDALREAGAGEMIDRAAEDPIVEIFLGLYDLAELDLPDGPDPTAPAAGSPDGFVPREALTMRRAGDGNG